MCALQAWAGPPDPLELGFAACRASPNRERVDVSAEGAAGAPLGVTIRDDTQANAEDRTSHLSRAYHPSNDLVANSRRLVRRDNGSEPIPRREWS
jgi:hypothetical protein